MPKARRKRDRIRQIAAWLRREFPTGRPVRVVFRYHKKDAGAMHYGRCVLTLVVDPSMNRREMIDTLIHEWAHALHEPVNKHHDGPWGLAYARIYSRFVDEGGEKESGGFPC